MQEIGGRLKATSGILGEAAAHDVVDGTGHGWLQCRDGGRLALEDRGANACFALAVERPRPRQRLVKERSEREQVAARIEDRPSSCSGDM